MEIELKYTIEKAETADKVMEDFKLVKMRDESTMTEDQFDAIYYDTKDFDLLNAYIAYRIRKEGKRKIATVKWKGGVEGALHSREELNVPLPDTEESDKPNPNTFDGSDIGEEIARLTEGKELVPIMETRVVRKAFRIDTGKTIMEVSLDDGKVITSNGETPIRELEIELFSGDQQELLDLGEEIATRYDLKPEKVSKYARGLHLLGKV